MTKCAACGRYLSQSDSVACTKCSLRYHQLCAGKFKNGKVPKLWSCPECQKNVPRDYNMDTPVRPALPCRLSEDENNMSIGEQEPHNSTATDSTEEFKIALEIRLFREELHTLHSEIKNIRQDMCELLSKNDARIEWLESRMEAVEKPMECKDRKGERLESLIAELRLEINDKEQELLANDIEITNLPENNNENPHNIVKLIAVKLGVQIDDRDVVSAERVGSLRYVRSTNRTGEGTLKGGGDTHDDVGRPRPLVIRLARRTLRDELLHSMRVRRGVNTADFGLHSEPRAFYINERLTKYNRHLLRKVRDERKRLSWKYVWTKRGRIYVRQDEGKQSFLIRTDKEMTKVFGSG
ncbi:unnamed protein product [Diatraea saccharalis]|uniref:Zinc finger PHD-type domain-containing protein n=1 Tax=Diatraea saccharalis TaxID=40085 RepID=A0A9N9W8G4_9NEOP|nr:unnamed protein product [Diatraea saccharalis]